MILMRRMICFSSQLDFTSHKFSLSELTFWRVKEMKVRFSLILLVGMLITIPAVSQDKERKSEDDNSESSFARVNPNRNERINNFSIEGLGRAGLYSINYDRMVTDDIAVGLGFSSYSISAGALSSSTVVIPLYANYYFTEGKNSRFYVTGGADLIFSSANFEGDGIVEGSGLGFVGGAGWEYKSDGGFLFRVAPYFLVGKASGAWLGISLGYSL